MNTPYVMGARERFLAAAEKVPDSGDGPARLCAACVLTLPVNRAGIAVYVVGVGLEVLTASDKVAERVEWAQVTLGEGPGVDAVSSGGPVAVPNLAHADGRWPMFMSEVADSGIGAMYALPLQVGAIKVGVLDLYCDAGAPLGRRDFADAVAVSDLVTAILLIIVGFAGHWVLGAAFRPVSRMTAEAVRQQLRRIRMAVKDCVGRKLEGDQP